MPGPPVSRTGGGGLDRAPRPSRRNAGGTLAGGCLTTSTGTSPHTLRHTWVSVLLSSGVPIVLVSRYAGHATIQTTADQCGHLVPGSPRPTSTSARSFDHSA
jgi:integrase